MLILEICQLKSNNAILVNHIIHTLDFQDSTVSTMALCMVLATNCEESGDWEWKGGGRGAREGRRGEGGGGEGEGDGEGGGEGGGGEGGLGEGHADWSSVSLEKKNS